MLVLLGAALVRVLQLWDGAETPAGSSWRQWREALGVWCFVLLMMLLHPSPADTGDPLPCSWLCFNLQ